MSTITPEYVAEAARMTTFTDLCHPKYRNTYLTIERACRRQNVKRGYILVWQNKTFTSQHVVSWHVYATKQDAMDAAIALHSKMTVN